MKRKRIFWYLHKGGFFLSKRMEYKEKSWEVPAAGMGFSWRLIVFWNPVDGKDKLQSFLEIGSSKIGSYYKLSDLLWKLSNILLYVFDGLDIQIDTRIFRRLPGSRPVLENSNRYFVNPSLISLNFNFAVRWTFCDNPTSNPT